MTTESEYYKAIVNKIDFVLRDSRNSPYIKRYCIIEGQDKHTYTIECEGNATYNVQQKNSSVQKEFLNDLKECLINDKPFQLKFNPNEELLSDFFEKIHDHIYVMNDKRHYSHPDDFIVPTVDEFENILKCFEPTLTSIDIIVRGMPRSYDKYNKDYMSFIPIVLSLHNEDFYNNKRSLQLKHIIKKELESLTVKFSDETNPLIAQGIQKYLGKKKNLLTTINDKSFENTLYEIIQSLVHSDFWAETASYLPSFPKKKKLGIDTHIFGSEGNPIFHLTLNREKLQSISEATITDKDLEKMLKEIIVTIENTKPKNIDFIQLIKTSEHLKLITAGQDMNNDLLLKVGKLFESMIYEYNSPNVSKRKSEDESDYDKKINSEYLTKAAQVLWMNIELDNSSLNTNKKKLKL